MIKIVWYLSLLTWISRAPNVPDSKLAAFKPHAVREVHCFICLYSSRQMETKCMKWSTDREVKRLNSAHFFPQLIISSVWMRPYSEG
jgi:hypothetical protein